MQVFVIAPPPPAGVRSVPALFKVTSTHGSAPSSAQTKSVFLSGDAGS